MNNNMTTHYHRCRSGRTLKTITRKDIAKVFVSTAFVDGGAADEGLDVLDALLNALEQVAEQRGQSASCGWLALPSGRQIFLIGANKKNEACCFRRDTQPPP